jgi:hypothetical protein
MPRNTAEERRAFEWSYISPPPICLHRVNKDNFTMTFRNINKAFISSGLVQQIMSDHT